MFDDFKLNWKNVSGLYIATLLSFLFFGLIKGTVLDIASWVYSLVVTTGGIQPDLSSANSYFWLAFFITCLLITIFIKKVIVDGLGLHMSDTGGEVWQVAIVLVIVLGSYVYLLNQSFEQAMPTKWMTPEMIKLFDGADYTYDIPPDRTLEESNIWAISDWLWRLGPIVAIYAFKMRPPKSD
jgi:hypothetical protein